jgi:hypothetical protein
MNFLILLLENSEFYICFELMMKTNFFLFEAITWALCVHFISASRKMIMEYLYYDHNLSVKSILFLLIMNLLCTKPYFQSRMFQYHFFSKRMLRNKISKAKGWTVNWAIFLLHQIYNVLIFEFQRFIFDSFLYFLSNVKHGLNRNKNWSFHFWLPFTLLFVYFAFSLLSF